MTAKDFDLFSEISINSDSEDEYYADSDSDIFFKKSSIIRHSQQYGQYRQYRRPPLEPINFEKYVQENCQNKIKLLQRSTFHQITKPIIIFFNHFREKCAYHVKYLDRFYELSLKYGDRIDFIAADMLDIDIMHKKWYSLNLFCNLVSPERESATIYAIDERKRITQLFAAEKTMDLLTEFCENLLQGKLFLSEPLPVADNSKLVKMCVHDNYKELVIDSKKNILLIVGYEDYNDIDVEFEPNYEKVAEQLVENNVDVVYINGLKNYIPFELQVFCHPTLLLIHAEDKSNFVDFLKGPRKEENVVKCLRQYLKDPKSYLDDLNKEYRIYRYVPLQITPDFNMDLEEIPQYLEVNCFNNVKLFDRKTSLKSNRFIIITYMHFPNGKCLAEHLKWIDKIYQVATNISSFKEYYIADIKDIDVINPQWKAEDFIQDVTIKPKVFAIDRNKNKFALDDFKNEALLFYFAYQITCGELVYSEPWPNINDGKLVKTCIAMNLSYCITSIKRDILLGIYYSQSENTEEFLQQLEVIAKEMKQLKLKVIKIDARLNYIPLEMQTSKYPVMYFIPREDKSKRILYEGKHLDTEDILDFINKELLSNKVKK